VSELRALCEAQRRRTDRPLLLATVVAVRGSSYRRPGARMVIGEDRWLAGSVSGGCLEGDVIGRGWWRIRDAAATVVTYDSTSEEETGWGVGLGCNGVVELLLERLTPGMALDPLAFLARCVADETTGVLATVFRSRDAAVPVGTRLARHPDGSVEHTLSAGAAVHELMELAATACSGTACREVGGLEVLVEQIEPPPHLFIFGGGADAVPLARVAGSLGWSVTVCDRHARWATRERFADADHVRAGLPEEMLPYVDRCVTPVAVVMSHDYDRDLAALGALLRSQVRFVGVLGPRERTLRMTAELQRRQRQPLALDRLHAPVGLGIGAEAPAEIAVSVAAEIMAALAGADAVPLRDRHGPIHGAATCPRPRLRAVD
jgi:xanthine dehydrogenase accessory factor